MSEKFCGTVLWFNSEKGYGFIRTNGSGKEIFVNQAGVIKGFITKDQTVRFNIEQTEKGLNAVNVEVLNECRDNSETYDDFYEYKSWPY